ncbi:hypothetical protein BDY21DRAFT_51693 [Lineolata rhizophorae]|uniref:Uncharacterized protein n=1 Tax=Lineolata rhizophorae TaxID=578093 RepID=A0A6A6NYE1_9PEZI|nr:hypothetical protein BDY21DRAFT_51693 [Lineolata rhizophorae]
MLTRFWQWFLAVSPPGGQQQGATMVSSPAAQNTPASAVATPAFDFGSMFGYSVREPFGGAHIFRRDVCDDAFPGEGASRNTCTPNDTLCCVRASEPFPQCEQYLGKGWCCVEE